MKSRINVTTAAPEAYRAMAGLEQYIHASGLEESLVHLLKMRASQINGCAYCIDMHSKDARSLGETEQRLYGLDAWREAPYYSDRERAALEWTEAVTRIADTHAPDSAYSAAQAQFSEKELADLTYAIVAINAWNRLAIAFRAEAGSYRVPERHPVDA